MTIKPVASAFAPNSLSNVANEPLDLSTRQALLSLLDDPQPSVRHAILARLLAAGDDAADFLREIASGKNRVQASHAKWFLDELKFGDPVAEFRGFIRSLNYELETGILLLTRTVSPRIDIAACCNLLDEIAARCRELIVEPMSMREQLRAINRVLFHDYHFRGNKEHYTDPLNSLFDQVLSRRKGIPISLSIVYLLIAERLNIVLEPVALPGHFMLGCYTEGQPFYIDPFEHGAFRSHEELYMLLRASELDPQLADFAPTSVREVLCRCCRNLAHHYASAGDEPHARLFASFVEEFEQTYSSNS